MAGILNKLLRLKELLRPAKIGLHKTVLRPIVLYGSKILAGNKKTENKQEIKRNTSSRII